MDITFKAARINAGLKQKQVAEIMNINVSTLRRYEKGIVAPDVNVAKKFSKLYGVNLDNLIFLQNNTALNGKMRK